MMVKLDEIAARLLAAKTKGDTVEAVGFRLPGADGGPQGNARARRTLQTRERVLAVHELLLTGKIGRDEAFGRVAKRFATTTRSVEEMYDRWLKPERVKGRTNPQG